MILVATVYDITLISYYVNYGLLHKGLLKARKVWIKIITENKYKWNIKKLKFLENFLFGTLQNSVTFAEKVRVLNKIETNVVWVTDRLDDLINNILKAWTKSFKKFVTKNFVNNLFFINSIVIEYFKKEENYCFCFYY